MFDKLLTVGKRHGAAEFEQMRATLNAMSWRDRLAEAWKLVRGKL